MGIHKTGRNCGDLMKAKLQEEGDIRQAHLTEHTDGAPEANVRRHEWGSVTQPFTKSKRTIAADQDIFLGRWTQADLEPGTEIRMDLLDSVH